MASNRALQATVTEMIGKAQIVYDTTELSLFLPIFRPHDEGVALVTCQSYQELEPEQLTYLSPEGIGLYKTVWTVGRGEGRWVDEFMRGACALTPLLEADSNLSQLSEFLARVAVEIDEHQVYPSLDTRFQRQVLTSMQACLLNGELSNLYQLLAYQYGVWWLLGHVAGVAGARVGRRRSRWLRWLSTKPVLDWIGGVLQSRAERSILEEY